MQTLLETRKPAPRGWGGQSGPCAQTSHGPRVFTSGSHSGGCAPSQEEAQATRGGSVPSAILTTVCPGSGGAAPCPQEPRVQARAAALDSHLAQSTRGRGRTALPSWRLPSGLPVKSGSSVLLSQSRTQPFARGWMGNTTGSSQFVSALLWRRPGPAGPRWTRRVNTRGPQSGHPLLEQPSLPPPSCCLCTQDKPPSSHTGLRSPRGDTLPGPGPNHLPLSGHLSARLC